MDVNLLYKELNLMYPNAKAELNFSNEYELLIATILSAQCTDKRVNIVTNTLFKYAPSPAKMVELGENKVRDIIKTCGMYKQKSRNIILTSEKILSNYNGKVPNNMQELVQLNGVGRKTANVVLSNAFGKPAIAVDTHVKRVSYRLGLTDNTVPDRVEDDLKELLPQHMWSKMHHLLIFHGRRICKARKPMCNDCRVNYICEKKGVSNA